ncbi:major facilitator superfamily domain-containing protein [Daedaleopsis nitida]|nr:major facilitator superfamily domain-containing protein [Daedaleopsis nitida]
MDSLAELPTGARKGSAFWLSFLALIVVTFVSALDVTALSTALPTITSELQGGDKFVWVSAASGIASTAILPLSGRLADAFGRRPCMLAAVALFFVGSALCGAAQSMDMLIAARAVQGMGSGAITTLSEIIVSDLVPLSERGMYMGIFAGVWAVACGVGPPLGGALAQASAWRWIFYMNLPLTGVAFVLVLRFLRVRTPPGSMKEKLSRLDGLGNCIIITGTVLAIIGLAWGGVRYAWLDGHVIATMIVGFVLIVAFFVYEWFLAKEPSVPWEVVSNRTTVGAYLGTFFHGITSSVVFYYLPVYLQACLLSAPLLSSLQLLPTPLVIAPFAFAAGALVQYTRRYRWANALGWMMYLVGFGFLSTLRPNSSAAQWAGFQILVSIGTGILFTSTVFPVLAPLPVSRNAAALAVYTFSRSFAQSWGVPVGSTILQNCLNSRLPAEFHALFPTEAQIAYAAIPLVKTLPEPLRSQVQDAFADSLAVVWRTMIVVSAVGLLSVALMREVAMPELTDTTYALDERADSPAESLDTEAGTTEKAGGLREGAVSIQNL